MIRKCYCPECGHRFEPDRKRRELEKYLKEKMEHSIYDDASFYWMDKYEMYIHLPRDSLYTTSVSEIKLPDNWKIKTIWCNDDETLVSVTLDE